MINIKWLIDFQVYKPFGTYNCCRLCSCTWWDDERPRHNLNCQYYEIQREYLKLAHLLAVETAARKLFETFEKYQPDGNHSFELWWRPNPSKTMAERDKAIDELASALEQK